MKNNKDIFYDILFDFIFYSKMKYKCIRKFYVGYNWNYKNRYC